MRAALEEKISLQRSTQTGDPIWVRVEWEPKNASLSLLDPKNLGCAAQLFRREGKAEERRALVRAAASAHPRRRVWLPEQPSRASAGPCLLVHASECAVQSRALAPTIGKASPAARSARSFAGIDIAPSLADPPVGRPTQEQEARPQGEGLLLLDCACAAAPRCRGSDLPLPLPLPASAARTSVAPTCRYRCRSPTPWLRPPGSPLAAIVLAMCSVLCVCCAMLN